MLDASRLAAHPVLCAASAAVTQAAKRHRHVQRHHRNRQLVRQRLRLIPRATVVNNVHARSTLYKAMNRASKLSRFMLLPSGRVMLSANAIGDVNAHHRIRHRARHGLRGRSRYRDLNAAPLLYPHGTAPAEQVRAVPHTPRCSRNLLRSQVPRQRPMRNAAMRRSRLLVPCRRGRRPRQSCRSRDEDARGLSLCSATAQAPGRPENPRRRPARDSSVSSHSSSPPAPP